MLTLCLLGDSILDNAPYTRPHPDTTTHLERVRRVFDELLGIADDFSAFYEAVARAVCDAARHTVLCTELRTVCTQPNDFVQQIEPSPAGARRSAEAIARVATESRELSSGRIFVTRPA